MTARAFLYGRHSTDKQDLTEDVQKDMCIRYYRRELQGKDVLLAGWYYDEAVSSAVMFSEREHGRIVMACLQPGDHLVVAKSSRPFRSVLDGENTLHQLGLRKVQVHFVDFPVDTTRAHGRFVRRVVMAADELWREVSQESAREVIEYRKREGLPFSRGVPVGWKVVGKKPHRTFRVDPVERAMADRIASLRASGMSLSDIALWGYQQKEFQNKRNFLNRDLVQWVLNARDMGYPKITGYKTVRRVKRLGQVGLGHPQP